MTGFISSPFLLAAGGDALLYGESDGLAVDFTDRTFGLNDPTQQMRIKDTVTPANSGTFAPQSKITTTTPALRLCRQSDGILRYQSHNLYLNSGSPANQSITVDNGYAYAVVITGSVSITWSGAWTGTTTAGTTNFTAATATATAGSTSGTGTVAVYRTPSVGNYMATAGAVVYDLNYDWDQNGVPLGILIGEQRTNLAPRAQELDNAAWTKSAGTATANATTAPDGTSTADLFTENTASTFHFVSSASNMTITAGSTYTVSVWAKANGRNTFDLEGQEGSTGNDGYRVFVDLSTGTINSTINVGAGTAVSSSITPYANGWYRVTVTGNFPTSTTLKILMVLTNPVTTRSYTGDGTSGIYFWGMQCELGTWATTLMHTLAATATRAADDIKTATSLFNFSATLGTLYAKFQPLDVSAIRFAAAMDNDTANERFAIGSSAAGAGLLSVIDTGVAQTAPLTGGTVTANANNGVAASWAANDFAVSANGSAAATDVSGTLPSPTNIRYGQAVSAASPLNGWLMHVVHLPRSMSDSELAVRSLV